MSNGEIFIKDNYQIKIIDEENKEAMIYKYDGKNHPILLIPENINEYKIVAIGNMAFFKNNYIREIVIPDNIKDIHSSAFECCNSLDICILPHYIKKIPDHAFANCYNLVKLIIPSSCESIGDDAFRNCFNIKTIQLSDKMYDYLHNIKKFKKIFSNVNIDNIEFKKF